MQAGNELWAHGQGHAHWHFTWTERVRSGQGGCRCM